MALTDLFEDLRRKRLQDPEVRNNGYCEQCEYRGYFWLADGTQKTCECRLRRLRTNALDRLGVPPKYRNRAWDSMVEAEGQDWLPGRIAALEYIKAAYVQALNQINYGGMRWQISNGRPARSIALIGGSRRIKSAWASQVFDEVLGHGSLMYYQFSALKAMLSDFKRLDEQHDWADSMGSYELIVIDGIHGGTCAPGFPAAWEAGIAARQNSGLATILLCEDEHNIDSYAWRDMLDDPDMMVLRFNLARRSPPTAAIPGTGVLVMSQPPQGRVLDDVEKRVRDYIANYGEPIIKLIYDGVQAPRDQVKAALDRLIETGHVVSRKKPGKNGTLTVYCTGGGPEPSGAVRESVSPLADDGRPQAEKPLTYTELEEITQVPRTTLFRWRKAGLSDDEIVSRAEAERT